MASTRFIICILALSPAVSNAAVGFLQQATSSHVRARAFAGLRFSPQDPAARTLLALDTNHDGRIDPEEIHAFAHAQGLDADAATEEFSSIDGNGDGVLDSSELQTVLGATPSTKHDKVELMTKPSSASAALSYDGKAQHIASETVHAKAPAELPIVVSSASSWKAAPKAELISEESRASVRLAAQKVAAYLESEEKEETKARAFDEKAADVRANSAALAKSTVQHALDAGSKAAHTKTNEMMATIAKLENDAQKAEIRSAALRAKSKLEMEEGNELMAMAQQALKQPQNDRM